MSSNMQSILDDEDISPASSPEPSSALRTMPSDFHAALDEFRDNWQRELKANQGNETENTQPPHRQQKSNVDQSETEAEQTLAEDLFKQASDLEQRGKVYDALPLYRKALQIMPDIERVFYEQQKAKSTAAEFAFKGGNFSHASTPTRCVNEGDDHEEVIDDLYEKFQMDLAQNYNGQLILSSRDANVITTEQHISTLPPEILLYILRWVISNQLDMRSLENCAAICKGFYLCARDEELWRSACLKIWGRQTGTPQEPGGDPGSAPQFISQLEDTQSTYQSWRQMFIERTRVLYSGCYISKTTYLRMGENSFQDQYYRPVQLVEYYRYIRFLPDGTMLMLTTADEPSLCVSKLRNLQHLRPDVLRGSYRLYGNIVTCLLQKSQQPQSRVIPINVPSATPQYGMRHQRRGSNAYMNDQYNNVKYRIEFRIQSSTKRKFNQLIWLKYSIVQNRNSIETISDFDLTQSKYPPLWFSLVRSYHLDSEAPLS